MEEGEEEARRKVERVDGIEGRDGRRKGREGERYGKEGMGVEERMDGKTGS